MIIKNLEIVKGLLKKEMKKKNAESCTTTVFSKYLSDFGKLSMFFGFFFFYVLITLSGFVATRYVSFCQVLFRWVSDPLRSISLLNCHVNFHLQPPLLSKQ